MRKWLFLLSVSLAFSAGITYSQRSANSSNAGAQVRFQYSKLKGDSYPCQVSSFDLTHIRPYYKGNLLEGKLTYNLLLLFDANATKVGILDAEANYMISKWLQIKFGQFKAPFDRQFLIALTGMQFVDRAIGGLKVLNRDRGATLRLNSKNDFLVGHLGVFNGNGMKTSYLAKNNAGKDDQRHLYTSRLTINPQGEFGNQMALPGKSQAFKTSVGLGYTRGQQTDTTDVVAWSADIVARQRGVVSLVEYQKKVQKTTRKQTTTGLTAQLGYFVHPKIELALRYSRMRIAGISERREITLGTNFYFAGNSSKLQVNYTRSEVSPEAGTTGINHRLEVLHQMVF